MSDLNPTRRSVFAFLLAALVVAALAVVTKPLTGDSRVATWERTAR